VDAVTEPGERAADVTQEELGKHAAPCQSRARVLKLKYG
jgi:hypothetical protein